MPIEYIEFCPLFPFFPSFLFKCYLASPTYLRLEELSAAMTAEQGEESDRQLKKHLLKCLLSLKPVFLPNEFPCYTSEFQPCFQETRLPFITG